MADRQVVVKEKGGGVEILSVPCEEVQPMASTRKRSLGH
jgi:hypothetical protein